LVSEEPLCGYITNKSLLLLLLLLLLSIFGISKSGQFIASSKNTAPIWADMHAQLLQKEWMAISQRHAGEQTPQHHAEMLP
jgi:hypothetical protein